MMGQSNPTFDQKHEDPSKSFELQGHNEASRLQGCQPSDILEPSKQGKGTPLHQWPWYKQCGQKFEKNLFNLWPGSELPTLNIPRFEYSTWNSFCILHHFAPFPSSSTSVDSVDSCVRKDGFSFLGFLRMPLSPFSFGIGFLTAVGCSSLAVQPIASSKSTWLALLWSKNGYRNAWDIKSHVLLRWCVYSSIGNMWSCVHMDGWMCMWMHVSE